MLDPPAIKGTGTANNPMHFITFFQKQLGQIRTILSSDAGDESFFQMLLNIFENLLERNHKISIRLKVHREVVYLHLRSRHRTSSPAFLVPIIGFWADCLVGIIKV